MPTVPGSPELGWELGWEPGPQTLRASADGNCGQPGCLRLGSLLTCAGESRRSSGPACFPGSRLGN